MEDKVKEMAMKRPGENGQHSCPIELKKFKKVNVSVIPDFPPGCGRNFEKVPAVANDENNVEMDDFCSSLEVDSSEKFGNGVESNDKEMIHDASVIAYAKDLETEGNSHCNETVSNALGVITPIISANGDDNHHSSLEGISHASDIDNKSNAVNHQFKEKNYNTLEIDATKKSLVVIDPELTDEGLKKSIPMNAPKNIGTEEGDAAAGLVVANNGEEYVDMKCLKMVTEVISNDEIPEVPGVISNDEIPGSSKIVGGELKREDILEGEATLGKDISSGILKPEMPPVSMFVIGVDGKKYPPRRRVSAVRDFPPLCGTPLHLAKMQSLNRKSSAEDATGQANPSDKKIVHNKSIALPWKKENETVKNPNLSGGASGSKVKMEHLTKEREKHISKKCVSLMPKWNDNLKASKEKSSMKKPNSISKRASHRCEDGDGEVSSDDAEKYRIVQRSNVNFSSCAHSGGRNADSDSRKKVRECLRMFHRVVRNIVRQNEAMEKGDKRITRRVDLCASGILKERGEFVNPGKQIMGVVPGVEVGDEYHYRVELNIIGLHRAIQGGIDYLKQGSDILATSIVASGGYADDLDESDVLIYSGSGGNVMQGNKDPEDQKLERGNLALKTSISQKNPVRVIRGFKEMKAAESSDARAKLMMTYTYDGLYLVTNCWQEKGQHGKLMFKFQLNRIEGQPELAWKEVKRASKHKAREGLCLEDICQGEEAFRICAVNTVDDEKPPPFKYVTKMIYPSWFRQQASKDGCNCVNGCSVARKCSCAVKNGGEIPYNYSGDIVEGKSLVYECGPSCRCPRTCYNRVSQHGIKLQLEVFKTEGRGWGVRALNSIASGNYICEYLGELLSDKEAEERAGNDEYLFDIGNNYHDHTMLHDAELNLIPDSSLGDAEEEGGGGYTIDAARFGNVGRFINHSCSPNLYAQNICYDHEDRKIPHIVFFAAENIPPLQELTYHYNYKIDQVRDANGNVKMKNCLCGSSECSGRMY